MNRPWDPSGEYKAGFLKEYAHWVLEVSFSQHTLGSFIIFAKREAERISDLNNQETTELTKVMSDIETALSKSPFFKPERFNYLQLGNGLHRLHFHGIPRYEKPRNFNKEEWIDKAWGHPPIWNRSKVSKEIVIKIKEEILKVLLN